MSFEGLGTLGRLDGRGRANSSHAWPSASTWPARKWKSSAKPPKRPITSWNPRISELAERATRDALTGLYNRTFFAESLNAAINAASRSAAPIGVVFCDIDHFKQLNDTYGHPFGDEVLRHGRPDLQRSPAQIRRRRPLRRRRVRRSGAPADGKRARKAVGTAPPSDRGGAFLVRREASPSSPSASGPRSSFRNAIRATSLCGSSRPRTRRCMNRSRTAGTRPTSAR